MLTITEPTQSAVAYFRQQQSLLDFNYPDVGCTSEHASKASKLFRYDYDRVEVDLGSGEETFAIARSELLRWTHFRVGWVKVLPASTPIVPGEVIAIQARIFGCWALAACRIIEVDDGRSSDDRCFAFSIGTLPGHPEQGEERFEIRRADDGRVAYRITAYFRANTWAASFGWPYFRYRFN
jgi:uncharacterized protein (UPF0548 family)